MQNDTTAPISELAYDTVTDSIIDEAKVLALQVPAGTTIDIEYTYEDAMFHDPAIAMLLAIKTQPCGIHDDRTLRYDRTLLGIHSFITL
jgi:hypothetical protein